MVRLATLFLPTLMLALSIGTATANDSRWNATPREGTIVHVTATELVMRARTWEVLAGTTYRYRLTGNALVTCDGLRCNLQDLRPGQRVRVTALAEGHWSLASRVEALDEQSTFPVAIATLMPGPDYLMCPWDPFPRAYTPITAGYRPSVTSAVTSQRRLW